jgi:alkylated DNA repair dioxygenase AlkB
VANVKGQRVQIPDAEVTYYPGFFSTEEAKSYYTQLVEKVDWVQNKIKMYGKENWVPRMEAWYGDAGMIYTYSGITQKPKPWFEELREIKTAIEPVAETVFNSVLINFYRDGQDRVGWHSDDEKELGDFPIIGSVSLGATRKFKLRHKNFKKNGLQTALDLENGSLLLMSGITQKYWKHEIPRTSLPVEGRINLTFRVIIPKR